MSTATPILSDAEIIEGCVDNFRCDDKAMLSDFARGLAVVLEATVLSRLAAGCEPVARVVATIHADAEVQWITKPRELPVGSKLYLHPPVAAPLQAGEAWQPIETAPKDGQCLLAIDTDDGYEFGVLTRDVRGDWIHEGEPTFCHSYHYEPTHWQPLPNPPAAMTEAPK